MVAHTSHSCGKVPMTIGFAASGVRALRLGTGEKRTAGLGCFLGQEKRAKSIQHGEVALSWNEQSTRVGGRWNPPDPSDARLNAGEFLHRHPERFRGTGDWDPPPGQLHLVFGERASKRPDIEIATVAKKAVLYGTHAYFLTPHRASVWMYETGWQGALDAPDMQFSFASEFRQFLEPLLPYVVDGCVDVFPTWDIDTPAGYGFAWTSSYKGLVQIELEKRYLLEQMTESPSALRILLPHVKDVPPNRLLDIRHEYGVPLDELHRALYGLLSADADCGDTKLYTLMQEVDSNVRRLDERVQRLSKKRWFERLKLAVVPFPMVLAAAVPPDFQEIVRACAAMLGSASAISYMSSVQETRQRTRAIEQSPFYVPWLLHAERGGNAEPADLAKP
jgi:hypothetical protein